MKKKNKKQEYLSIPSWKGDTYFYLWRILIISYVIGLMFYLLVEINTLMGIIIFLTIDISLLFFLITDFFCFIHLIKTQKRRSQLVLKNGNN